MYSEDLAGERTLHGIIGIHFNITIFEKTIDPLIENENSDYRNNVLYWVYPIRQYVEQGKDMTVTDYIHENS